MTVYDGRFALDEPDARTAAIFAALARRRWGLTPTQARLLLRVVAGTTAYKALARALDRDVCTIRNHLGDIYTAMQLPRRAMPTAVLRAWPVYRQACDEAWVEGEAAR